MDNSQHQIDYLTLIPSFSALIISASAFYNQFFKKTYKLLFNLGSDSTVFDGPFAYSVALCNIGNTEIVISEIVYKLMKGKDAVSQIFLDRKVTLLPLVVKPGEISLINLSRDINLLDDRYIVLAYKKTKKYVSFKVVLSITCLLANGIKRVCEIEFVDINFLDVDKEQPTISHDFIYEFYAIDILSKKYSRVSR